jgi:hypothetical protein
MALLWTQKQDIGPTGRIFPAMTFDASRERVLLFGGQLGGAANLADTWSWEGADLADTWAWDGAAWTEVAHFGPPAAMAVTAECDGHTVLLFGGGIASSSPLVPFGGAGAPPVGSTDFPLLGDTWEMFDPAVRRRELNYRAGGPPKPISFPSSSR